jgi:hypothetical protein
VDRELLDREMLAKQVQPVALRFRRLKSQFWYRMMAAGPQ